VKSERQRVAGVAANASTNRERAWKGRPGLFQKYVASMRPVSFAAATPVRFAIAGAMAAGVNFGSRILLSFLMEYAIAIVVAYLAGMATAFVLNRRFVFKEHSMPLRRQLLWFTTINLFALAQTLTISLLLARIVLPMLHVVRHDEEIAHAFGIVVPILSSYLGHKHLTFR
jgi:putative flippase GtrA